MTPASATHPPTASRRRPETVSVRGGSALGWAAVAILAAALGWRAWTACAVTLFGWTPIDRCGTAVALTDDAVSVLAATPLLQAERHRAGLTLAATEDRCPIPGASQSPAGLADLAGCWRYVGPGETMGDPQEDGWDICLSGDGTGRQSVDLPGGVVCDGPVAASWSDGSIAVLSSVGDTPCDDGSDLFQVIQRCQWNGPGRVADCIGAQPAQGIGGIPGRLVPLNPPSIAPPEAG